MDRKRYRGETNTIHVTLIHFCMNTEIKSNQEMFTAAIPDTASFRMGWKIWQKIGGATGQVNSKWTRIIIE